VGRRQPPKIFWPGTAPDARRALSVSSLARHFHDGVTKFADVGSDVVNAAQFWSSCGSRAVLSGIEGLVWCGDLANCYIRVTLLYSTWHIRKANSHRHAEHDKTVLSVSRPFRRCELDSRQLKTVADRKSEVSTRQ